MPSRRVEVQLHTSSPRPRRVVDAEVPRRNRRRRSLRPDRHNGANSADQPRRHGELPGGRIDARQPMKAGGDTAFFLQTR